MKIEERVQGTRVHKKKVREVLASVHMQGHRSSQPEVNKMLDCTRRV